MTGQNTSSAVMAQRREAADSLDFFPTPPWATRALIGWLLMHAADPRLHLRDAWDPACGQGDMARPLGSAFDRVVATDVHDWGAPEQAPHWRPDGLMDFLFPVPGWPGAIDWIVTNPPFRLGAEVAQAALQRANAGVALLVRTAFLEGQERFTTLFRPCPPTAVLQFTERVVIWKGRLVDPDVPILHADGQVKRPTSATAYAWLVWDKQATRWGETRFDWIDPCRALLTCPGDYPPPPALEAAPAPLFPEGDLPCPSTN